MRPTNHSKILHDAICIPVAVNKHNVRSCSYAAAVAATVVQNNLTTLVPDCVLATAMHNLYIDRSICIHILPN